MTTSQLLGSIEFLLALAGVLATALLVWTFLSPIPCAARWALEAASMKRVFAFRRMRRLCRILRWPAAVFQYVRQQLDPKRAEPSLRILIDERLKHLKAMMARTEEAVRRACSEISHLGQGGPAAVQAEVRSLETRTREVAELGGEIPSDLVEQYQKRSETNADLLVAIALMAIFIFANAAFINLFLKTWLPEYYFGVPVSIPISMAIVAAEVGVGWLIARNSPAPEDQDRTVVARWLYIVVAGGFAAFEAFAFGTLSAGWKWDLSIFDHYPWMRYWMAIVGLMIVPVTVGVGYQAHVLQRERSRSAGALRLKKEIELANRYVDELPQRWDVIGQRARSAEAAIATYGLALGGREGVLAGSVDRIQQERAALSEAIAGARIDDWNDAIEPANGDLRHDLVLCLGIAIISLVGLIAYWWGLSALIGHAFRSVRTFGSVPRTLTAAFVTLAIYSVGFLPFQRLHHMDGRRGRTYPLRTSRSEYAVAVLIAVAASIGMLWISVLAYGVAGVFLGLLFVAGGGLIAMLGYFAERTAQGLVFAVLTAAAAASAGAAFALAVTILAIGWTLWLVFWTTWSLLTFLACPALLLYALYRHLRAARRESAAPSHASQPAPGAA